MPTRPLIPPAAVVAVAAAAVATALTGCRGSAVPHAAAASYAPSTSTSATPTESPAQSPTTRPRGLRSVAAFRWSSAGVTAVDLGRSWRPGCPVAPSALRALTVTTWGFDRRAHTGKVVVAAAVVPAVVDVFRRIYAARFPIRRMTPIAAYGGSDDRSMAADNTSGFNCRYAVSDGPRSWSMHAYGRAIDIDPLENPYTLNGRVYPPAGTPYTDRGNVRPGMVVRRSAPVEAFSADGWGWGGNWPSSPDYQHFSSNGR